MHQPLAAAAGVSIDALEAVRLGRRPEGLATDEQAAIDVATELMQRHGVCDHTWQRACATFGESGVVELTALVGYFVMVSWVMNAARTPSRPTTVLPLLAHPL
jgi:4-carboxymuconolactone decarboxylase